MGTAPSRPLPCDAVRRGETQATLELVSLSGFFGIPVTEGWVAVKEVKLSYHDMDM